MEALGCWSVLVHLEITGVRTLPVPLTCCPVEGKFKGRRPWCRDSPSKSVSGISTR